VTPRQQEPDPRRERRRLARWLATHGPLTIRMEPPPPVVVLATPRGPPREAIRRALGNGYELEPCDRGSQLTACLARGDVGAVVARLDDADGAPLAPALAELRRGFPTLPIAVVAPPDEPRAAARLVTLRHMVPDVLVVDRVDELSAVLARGMAAAPPPGPYHALMAAIDGRLDGEIARFVRVCVYNPGPLVLLEPLLDACGMARRTLEEQLAALGYPSPAEIFASATVSVGTWCYSVGRPTLDAVASRLRLESGTYLSLMCERVFTLAPTTVQAIGWRRVILPLWAWQFRLIPPRDQLAV